MRLKLVVLAALVTLASSANAQSWHGYSFTVGKPDCRLAARSSEDFITDGANQIYARRWQLEGIRIGGAFVASWAVSKFFPSDRVRSSPVISSFIGGVGVGLLPHLRSQIIQRRYPIDLAHDGAQAAQSMIPFILAQGHKDHSLSGHINTILTASAILLGTACWAQG